ncbi:MAG: HAD hydrolase family protein [Bacteriovoracales bacterium]|nr:HAD hydrolase family protein [Bacteriovoracales bacterium]
MVKNVAFIPLRGGSKAIPLKNIIPIAGKPLCHWAIEAALEAKCIDRVVVSTDSHAIEKATERFKGHSKFSLFRRSSLHAQDHSSTEDAMLEYFEDHLCQNIVLIQATSPILTSRELDHAMDKFERLKTSSLLSVAPFKRFIWTEERDNPSAAKPLNYDFKKRPLRQKFHRQYVENGAFYIIGHQDFIETKCRLKDPVSIYQMSELSSYEIDNPEDIPPLEKYLQKTTLRKLSKKIKLMATDMDGVLTDSGMYYDQQGNELKKFNTRDGHAFEIARKKGLITAIITKEETQIAQKRAEKIRSHYLHQGISNKLKVLEDICKQEGIKTQECLYFGDDLGDLDIFDSEAFCICPQDAVEVIRRKADYISSQKGGHGVLREAIDAIYSQH